MKRLTNILVLLLCLAAVSCSKKDNPEPDESGYYFRFKVDGVKIDYPYALHSQSGTYSYNEGTGYSLIINARKNPQSASNDTWGLILGTWNNEAETSVTYTENTPVNIVGAINFQYLNENGTIYLASRNYGNVSIRIDELTDTHIRGIFSGTLENLDTNGGVIKVVSRITVTGGEFYVPRQ